MMFIVVMSLKEEMRFIRRFPGTLLSILAT